MTDRWPGSQDHPFWKIVSGTEKPPGGVSRLLNWTVEEAVLGSGEGTSRFEVSEDFVNSIGGIQGGFVTAMLDDSMLTALATLFEANERAPTLELKVIFLRPARPGSFTGEGRVVHRGRSIAFLEGKLRDAEGRLVATATATQKIILVSDGEPGLQASRQLGRLTSRSDSEVKPPGALAPGGFLRFRHLP